jgi:cytoskeletal protein CcmA (bactofilin family)
MVPKLGRSGRERKTEGSMLMLTRMKMVIVCIALGAFAGLHAEEAKRPAVESDLGSDHFVFGGTVRVDEPVAGDLIAAGGNVDVNGSVTGDAVLAGGNVRLGASVGQNVYAAGGRLTVDGAVGRNLRITGGQVELGPKASVAGNVTAGGGQVTLRGAVKGAVQVGGGRVLIDGPVDGDVISTAGRLELGPNARLAGKLRYSSRDDIKRDPAAQIAGAMERLPIPGVGASGPSRREHAARGFVYTGGWLLWSLGLMLIAAVLVGALPATSQRVAQTLRSRFGWSLLFGFIALVCIPVAALVLLISIVGVPLALLVMLLYFALPLVGYVASGVAIGQWTLERFKADATTRTTWRVGAAMLAMLLLSLLVSIPFVGGFVALVAVLAGIGAITLQLAPRKTASSGLPPARV